MTLRQLSIALLTYSTRPRGGVVHTLALAEALAAAGHDVTVWSLARGGDAAFFRPVDPRVRIELIPVADIPDEPLGPRVRRSIEALSAGFTPQRYDVVHAQDCITANAAGSCIRTVHHLDHFTTPELAACHERAIVAPHTHVCVSAAVAGELAAGWGIHATVIGNGVEADRFDQAAGPDPAAAARRAGWQQRLGRYVLSVGGIEPRKGSLELLEAMALVRVERPDVQLVIAGGETLFDYRDYRAAWEQTAQRLGLSPVVLGPVPHDELPSLVAAADVFAFPSTKEGFGLAAMEALAAGVPVVANDLPVLREVFSGAVTFAATRREFAAELLACLGRDDVDRAAAGRTLAARHTWDAAARAHLQLYRRILSRAA
jgi:glycosyltransferase-like protein